MFAKRFLLCSLIAWTAVCGAFARGSGEPAASAAKDTVTIWTYPVVNGYDAELERLKPLLAAKYPNISLDIQILAWADGAKKFDVALNAGNPPDIYFGQPNSKYLDTGLALAVGEYLTAEEIGDYYENVLELCKFEGKVYLLPMYEFLHCFGGNKDQMEKAGIDYVKIQKEGWTWEQFKEYAGKGVYAKPNGDKNYGLVYYTQGAELEAMLALNSGMPQAVLPDGTVMYKNPNFKDVYSFMSDLMKTGIMPKETAGMAAGLRWQWFYEDRTMFMGKGIPYFDKMQQDRNAQIDAGTIKGPKTNFVILPIPHKQGEKAYSVGGAEGYMLFRQKKAQGIEHYRNAAKIAYFLTSGTASKSAIELCLLPVTKSGAREFEGKDFLSPWNKEATKALASIVYEKKVISPELAVQEAQFKNSGWMPAGQGVIAGELTPDAAYAKVVEAADRIFKK